MTQSEGGCGVCGGVVEGAGPIGGRGGACDNLTRCRIDGRGIDREGIDGWRSRVTAG